MKDLMSLPTEDSDGISDENLPIDSHVFEGKLINYTNEDFRDIAVARLGWAVSEQLMNILEQVPCEECNINAVNIMAEFARKKNETELAEFLEAYLAEAGYEKNR